MPRDELRQPLRKRSLSERLWARRPSALVLASLFAVAGFAGGGLWLARIPYPFAGEPIVTAAIPPVADLQTASIDKAQQPADAGAPGDEQLADTAPVEEQFIDQAPEPAREEANIIVSTRRPLKAAPIATVTEPTEQGPLPKVSNNGKRPSEVYAQATPMGVITSDRPKIAILLGGMGLNTRLTQKAIGQLPGNVTFGFAPYGEDLQAQVNKARAQGHEVMLQLPMEPVGYPGANPGPNTLLAEGSEADNLKSLRWHMSRFAGYTGIANYMGSRFLSEPAVLRPVMAEMKKRGLVFLQDANAGAGGAREVARLTGLRMQHSQIVIDATADADSIEAALAKLEEQAKADGFAIGTGAGLEITIDVVTEWAKQLESRGYHLVPVSAVYRGRMS